MGTYRLWPATDGPGAQQVDGDNYSMGVEFYVDAAGCTATELHFWCSTTLVGSDHVGRLFTVDSGGGSGTQVAGSAVTLPSPLQPGWNTVPFDAPVELVADQRYRAVVFFTIADGYTATGSYWSSGAGSAGIANGPLTAPSAAAAEGADQCSFTGGSSISFPPNSFNAGNYWIDLTVDDNVAPPGSVDAGRDRPVLAAGAVTLGAVADPPPGETVTGYAWTVLSGGGSLTGAATATPTYTAPSGTGTAVAQVEVMFSDAGTATDTVTVGYGPNIVAAENQLAGAARATWDLADPNLAGVASLQGFADGFSVDRTGTVSFKIAQSDAAGWSAQVYRLGWYGGDGARLVDELTPDAGQVAASQAQPAPDDADAVTTKLSADCSAWSTTLTWDPPAWAPSGIYLLRLNRVGGGASHVMFVLRDDARTADLMVMPSDTTWMAYNAFGGMGANLLTGNSLYFGTPVDQYNTDAARVVSYDRPVVNRAACNTGQAYGEVRWSNFFTGEFPMIRFLERNGFDAKYYACLDAAGDPTGALLDTVSAGMFIGHNEYWSDDMRAGWEAAKAAGMSVFSCAANEVFWRMVGVGSPDTESRPRAFECYKSTIASRGSTGRAEWTGTWRDPDGAGKGGDNPENVFTGTIFAVNGTDLRALVVPFTGGYSAQPLWRDTEVADLTTGSWTSPAQILGFEWDTYGPDGLDSTGAAFLADPHPLARYCSNLTASPASGALTDAGDQYAVASVTHRLVVTPSSPAGGITFGTGTINWSLGLDDANTYQQGADNTSLVIRQATVNMLVDMGASPSTLMAGLTEPEPVAWFTPELPAQGAWGAGFFGVSA